MGVLGALWDPLGLFLLGPKGSTWPPQMRDAMFNLVQPVFNHITIWGSLVFYFILTFFYNFVVAGKHPGTLATAMREPVRV